MMRKDNADTNQMKIEVAMLVSNKLYSKIQYKH